MISVEEVKEESKEEIKNPTKSSLKKEQESKKTVKETQKQYIYCGPKFKSLSPYVVYVNGYPKVAEKHFEKCPTLKKMFVPINEFLKFQKMIRDKRSAEYAMVSIVSKYVKGVAK